MSCGYLGFEPFTDGFGLWYPDHSFVGGEARSLPQSQRSFAGDLNRSVFFQERFSASTAAITTLYDFLVPTGYYMVELYFMEFDSSSRVFNVLINGVRALSSVDIRARSGRFRPLIIPVDAVAVEGNNLEIAVERISGNSKINGIKIFTAPNTTVVQSLVDMLYIRCGDGQSLNDLDGRVWQGDTNFGTDRTVGRKIPYPPRLDDVRSDLRELFYSERVPVTTTSRDPGTRIPVLSIPYLVNSIYNVTFLFAETAPNTVAGARVFDLEVNGVTVVYGIDIVKRVGLGKVLSLSATVLVANNTMKVSFIRVKGGPTLNALYLARTGTLETYTPPVRAEYLLRCGYDRNTYVDDSGRLWDVDQFFDADNTRSRTLSRTLPQGQTSIANLPPNMGEELFYYERYSKSIVSDPMFYDIPAPAGLYAITLYFIEMVAIDARSFDILVNEMVVKFNFSTVSAPVASVITVALDPVATVGGIRIAFQRREGTPKINALQVVKMDWSDIITDPPVDYVYINAGSNTNVQDADGNVWEKDRYFVPSNTNMRTTVSSLGFELANATADLWPLFYTERVLTSAVPVQDFYRIPFAPGNYTLTLYFAEILYNKYIPRVFDVLVNNATRISGLNVFEEVDLFAVAQRTIAPVQPQDGFIIISLRMLTGQPKINALKIEPMA